MLCGDQFGLGDYLYPKSEALVARGNDCSETACSFSSWEVRLVLYLSDSAFCWGDLPLLGG